MLPFVIGGGVLISLSFLLDGSNAGTPNFGSGNHISIFLNHTGNLAFGMMFPVLAGFIAMDIGGRSALAPGFIGGLIAKSGLSLFIPQDLWSSSGFIGALLAGFVAGYLVKGIEGIFDRLSSTLDGIKTMLLLPFCGILGVSLLMVFIINPPVTLFNTWINEALSGMGGSSKLILGLILGGMMSIDFGGPLNKAAYLFGTASVAAGQFDVMAAVMAGGMVPPLAISLATLFFKNKFTETERRTSATNFIMGLSFVTEGAIPFAASDPLRIIPSCACGAAVAGGLSMLFGCASRAPHGGIFVIAIIENPLMFILALVSGSVVGMLLIALLKKNIEPN